MVRLEAVWAAEQAQCDTSVRRRLKSLAALHAVFHRTQEGAAEQVGQVLHQSMMRDRASGPIRWRCSSACVRDTGGPHGRAGLLSSCHEELLLSMMMPPALSMLGSSARGLPIMAAKRLSFRWRWSWGSNVRTLRLPCS